MVRVKVRREWEPHLIVFVYDGLAYITNNTGFIAICIGRIIWIICSLELAVFEQYVGRCSHVLKRSWLPDTLERSGVVGAAPHHMGYTIY